MKQHLLIAALLILSMGGYHLPVQGQPVEQQIRRAAISQLHEQYPSQTSHVEVRVEQMQGVPSTVQSLQIRFAGAGVPRGRVQVDLLTGGTKQGWKDAGWALLYVAHFDSVMVSQRTLMANSRISPEAIAPAWVEVTRFRGEPLTPETYRKLRTDDRCMTARYIREGEVLLRRTVRPPYTAKAGEMLMMFYERHGISAHLRCRARESGFAGDVIRLSCRSTGSVYRARLGEDGNATWIQTL